ncbi:MAG: glycoside hydrolase family 3 C-terminal domain-containing protein [Bacteroidaceae bacterium]|nr:glycoside hydrolase family 3 C-terminal domain-containing protein [Bacteroidaceae bacterium]
MTKKTSILGLLLLVVCAAQAQRYPYQNPNLSPKERARDLCQRLTLEEKVGLMMNHSRAVERLDVPVFQWWSEALHGVGRNGNATVFPITMGLAATFDTMLVERVFTAVSDEARVKFNQAQRLGTKGEMYHGLSFWTPNINIFRDPRWGRGQETYGEDPYLTAVMGKSVVRGLQGPQDAPYQKLLACAKHYAVHSGPEWSRHRFDAENIKLRDLHETYLYAFRALVKEAKVSEVMCAYNRFEGKPCCGSDRLLQQILRDEWGFDGLVTSDCGAVDDFWMDHGHHYSKGKTEATSQAVIAGTDVECGGSYGSLRDGVREGRIKEETIDKSLCRLLEARFRLGDFDDPQLNPWNRIPDDRLCCQEHNDLALEAARKSIVLLRNEKNILPLDNEELRIKNEEFATAREADSRPSMVNGQWSMAIMGPNAADQEMQWGNYNGFPLHTITMEEGIRSICPSARFIPWQKDVRQQVEAAGDAQTVIFCGGISPRLEGEEMPVDEPGFKGGDRTMIELPQTQRDILAALHEAGKRVVLVLCSGSAIGLVPEQQTTDAILQAWYGGQAGGQAVAEVLFGRVNPSGRLPVTFYRNVDQLPDYENYDMEGHTYRFFRGEPLYPFGYGLSYSRFVYGKASYADGRLSFRLTNKSKRDGTETVLVYLTREGDTDGPIRTLRAIRRVDVPAGTATDVSIQLPDSAFEWWDAKSNAMRILPGRYVIQVGNQRLRITKE